MPRVKHEAHLVAVPAVLRLHPLWLSSPLLNSTCKEHGNCIPFQLYKQVFEKTDEIATRLSDLEGITSPSAVAAGTLCTNIQSAYHGLTGMHLYRANPSISRYRPAPAPISASGFSNSNESTVAAELRNELSRVQRVLVQHLTGIQDSAVNIQSTQTSLKRRIDAIEKNDGSGSAMEAMVRKAESRVGILEQRGQIVSTGMSDALKRVGELETRLDFQDSLLMSCKDAVSRVNDLQARQVQQEENINKCLVDIKKVGSRLDGLEATMREIKAMLGSGSPSGTPAPEAPGNKPGQLPTPPKETPPEELAAQLVADAAVDAAGTETPPAKRQRTEAVAESITIGIGMEA